MIIYIICYMPNKHSRSLINPTTARLDLEKRRLRQPWVNCVTLYQQRWRQLTSFWSVGVLVLTPVKSFHLRTPMTAWRTHDPRLPVRALDSSSTTPHKTEFTTNFPPSFSLFSATSLLIGKDLLSLIKPKNVFLSKPNDFSVSQNASSWHTHY